MANPPSSGKPPAKPKAKLQPSPKAPPAKQTVPGNVPATLTRAQLASAAFDKVGMLMHGVLKTKSNQLYLALHGALDKGELTADELKELGGHIRRHLKVDSQTEKDAKLALLKLHIAKQEQALQKHKNAVKTFDELLDAFGNNRLGKPQRVKLPSRRFAVTAAAALALGLGAVKGVEQTFYNFAQIPGQTVRLKSDVIGPTTKTKIPPAPVSQPRRLVEGPIPKKAQGLLKWMERGSPKERTHLLTAYSKAVMCINDIMNRTGAVWRESAGPAALDQKLRLLVELHMHFANGNVFKQKLDVTQNPDFLIHMVSTAHAVPVTIPQPAGLAELEGLPPVVKILYKPKSRSQFEPLPSPLFPTPETADILANQYSVLADKYAATNKARALKLKELALALKSHWLDLSEEDEYIRVQCTAGLAEAIKKLGGKVAEPTATPSTSVQPEDAVKYVTDETLPIEGRVKSLLILIRGNNYVRGDVTPSGKVPVHIIAVVNAPVDQTTDRLVSLYTGKGAGDNYHASLAMDLARELRAQGNEALALKLAKLAKALSEPKAVDPHEPHEKIYRFAMDDEAHLGEILKEIRENPQSALEKLVAFHSGKIPAKHSPPADAPIEQKLDKLIAAHANPRVNRVVSPRMFEVGKTYYNYVSAQLRRIGNTKLADKTWELVGRLHNAPMRKE